MKPRLNMDKIAKGLGGEQRGKVETRGGYFGAMQLLADMQERLRAPAGGGRPTDPQWTERRLLPLAPETLKRLEELADKIRAERGVKIEPMQLAALLLERATDGLEVREADALFQWRRATGTGNRKS
jgi:hypothetical protein